MFPVSYFCYADRSDGNKWRICKGFYYITESLIGLFNGLFNHQNITIKWGSLIKSYLHRHVAVRLWFT